MSAPPRSPSLPILEAIGITGLGVWQPVADLTFGQRVWGHGGSIPGYRAFAGYLPDYRIAFSLLINSDNDELVGAVTHALLRVILGRAGELTG